MHYVYLLFNVGGPETSNGAFMGVGREEGWADAGERLVEVLNDDHGLAHRLAVVDEHGHLLVHGVGLEEELALVAVEVLLLEVLVAQAFEAQRKLPTQSERAREHAL